MMMNITKLTTIAVLGLILSGCGRVPPAEMLTLKKAPSDEASITNKKLYKLVEQLPSPGYNPWSSSAKTTTKDRLIDENINNRQNRNKDLKSYVKYK